MSKILMLCNTFPPNIGGSERVLGDLASGLAARGHDVTVFTPAAEQVTAEQVVAENLRVVRSRMWRTLHHLGGSPNKLVSRAARAAVTALVLERSRSLPAADVIITGHILPLGLVALKLRAQGRAAKVLAITYGEDVTVYARGSRMRRHLVRVLEEADAVTCLTQDSAAEIVRLAPSAQGEVHVIPPAVEHSGDGVSAEEVAQLRKTIAAEGSIVLLTVGRLVPRKGVDVTLRALAKLRDPNLLYVIVGDGQDRGRLEALARQLDVSDHVRFAGLVDDARSYYRMCDIFCMPNRQMEDGEREGFGIVFLEAGVAGKPVIGGRSGGAQDAILENETGMLVKPDEVEEIASAISRLAGDAELRDRLGERGHEWAANFRAEKLLDSYDSLLTSLLAERT
jgi:phosphatidylinositol alpha-1,6-mannosyltransferase